jgi:hypothetical protein
MSRTAARQVEIDVPAAVKAYRANEVQIRRLRNVALGRNYAATEHAIERRLTDQSKFELALLLAGHRELVGELVDESRLVSRIREIGDEDLTVALVMRLAKIRSRITLLVRAAG